MNDPQLVPLGAELPATTSDAERSTSGSALLVYQSDAGAIHASLRYARIRRMRIEFTLDVVNATDEPLLATIYAIANNASEIPVAPYAFWIDRRTEAYLDLPLAWLTATTCRAISVRLQGRNAHQRLEAAMPRPSFLGWFAAGALVVATFFELFLGLQPRVVASTVPASATAGARINVDYAFAGGGTHEWQILDLSGARIEGGTLGGNTGTASIPVPRVPTQTAYAVRFINRGAFGSAIAEHPLIVNTPRPSQPPPRIASVTLDTAQVVDGTPVTVRYRVSAQYGDILASDAQGTIWAQQPLDASGTTVLQLPRFGHSKELQIRLVARRGDAEVSSGVGLMVSAPDSIPPHESLSPARGNDVSVLDQSVTPGGRLHLSVGDGARDVDVSFTTQDGTPLSSHTRVPSGAVTVNVPREAKNLVVVVVTYRRGSQEDTIVKKMPVD